jgi:hypothetical protein
MVRSSGALPDFRTTPLDQAVTTTIRALAERAGVPGARSLADAA